MGEVKAIVAERQHSRKTGGEVASAFWWRLAHIARAGVTGGRPYADWCYADWRMAMASTSTSALRGSSATAMVERAGGSPGKNSA